MEDSKVRVRINPDTGSIEPKQSPMRGFSGTDSRELRRAAVEHMMEIEDKQLDTQLKSCCNTTSDKRLLVFVSSFSISLIVVTFSCVQLSITEDCHSQNTYVGLLTLIIGIWLKSPVT